MSTIEAAAPSLYAPPHVPPELVVPYDFANGPEVMAFPPNSLDEIRKARPVFYSSYFGGFWVFTSYEDIRAAFQNHELFPQSPQGLPKVDYGKKLAPLMVDPPEHTVYRKLLTPIFSPPQIRRLEPIIRTVIRQILEEYGPQGKIEFARQFSLSVSSAMFCGMLDLPLTEFPIFHDMSYGLIYGTNTVFRDEGFEAAQAHRLKKMSEIREFIRSNLPMRKAKPGVDILSILIGSKVYDRPLTDDEMVDVATLVFFAGTDSTAGSISYAHVYLAQHPKIRQQLIEHIDDEDYIWNAAEELNRFHGFHHITRKAAYDAEFAGVQIKKDDEIILPLAAANHDPERFPEPLKVDLERINANKNLTFGAGIHRCMGSALATTQLRLALQEVHKAIPDYKIEGEVEFASGGQKIVPNTVNFSFTPVAFKG